MLGIDFEEINDLREQNKIMLEALENIASLKCALTEEDAVLMNEWAQEALNKIEK